MEHEENEDLLFDISESDVDISDKEDSDCYLEGKILDFIKQDEKQCHKSKWRSFLFIIICLLLFLSSSLLIITFPIYIVSSTQAAISTYSKLITLSFIFTICLSLLFILLIIIRFIKYGTSLLCIKCMCCLPNVLKSCFFFTIGCISIFWLQDSNFVPCHLQDPLKGCEVIFSLLFYFILCRKKMSLEKIFCTITVIVGVFVTVDFGLCDKYHCYGLETSISAKSHFIWILTYLFAHGLWVLHFTMTESYFTNLQLHECSKKKIPTSSMLSIISNIRNSSCEPRLSNVFPHNNNNIIVNVDNDSSNYRRSSCSNKLSLKLSVPTSPVSSPSSLFPKTSTPNIENNILDDETGSYLSRCCHNLSFITLQHMLLLLVVIGLFWTQTTDLLQHNTQDSEMVLEEMYNSVCCHIGVVQSNDCYNLTLVTVILTTSYCVFVMCCVHVIDITLSSVTVVCLIMTSLPMSGIWWSLYSLVPESTDMLEFTPTITGESVSALLGFPIIGIGVLLLVKSHIKSFDLLDQTI